MKNQILKRENYLQRLAVWIIHNDYPQSVLLAIFECR